MWSTSVSIFAVGGMFGSVVGQFVANSLGRLVDTTSCHNLPVNSTDYRLQCENIQTTKYNASKNCRLSNQSWK